jgi:hypothetical protein
MGDSASPECVGSTCDFTVGRSASVSCRGGAVCDVVVRGESSTVRCMGSTCRVTCEVTGCGVDCGDGSTCLLQCPGESSGRGVTGEARCE